MYALFYVKKHIEFLWFTHFWRKFLLWEFMHFFRRLCWTEKQNLQTFLLFGCMNSRQDTDGRHKDEVGYVAQRHGWLNLSRDTNTNTPGWGGKRWYQERNGLRNSLRIHFDVPMTDTRKIHRWVFFPQTLKVSIIRITKCKQCLLLNTSILYQCYSV